MDNFLGVAPLTLGKLLLCGGPGLTPIAGEKGGVVRAKYKIRYQTGWILPLQTISPQLNSSLY